MVHLSIIQLAEKTKSSEATIFRLCKRLGFSGYQDLKIALAQEIVQEPVQHIHEEMSPDDDIEVIIRKVFRTNISGLTDTFQLLDPADVEKAVEMIHRADRIEFYGNGGSGLIATDAYHKFMRTGINCIAHTDSHFQAMSAGLLGPESAVIGISHSGSNKDVLDAVKTAKSLGAGTIGITSYQSRRSPRFPTLCCIHQQGRRLSERRRCPQGLPSCRSLIHCISPRPGCGRRKRSPTCSKSEK